MSVAYHLGRFPPTNIEWERLIPLIGPANAALARYEGVLAGVPNPDVLLGPLTTQEAVLSSRIEGTQATLGEVLEFEAIGDPDDESTPQKADIREVFNYRSALIEASRLLTELPLSQRLIRETHSVLMDGVRGRNKDPGEYRRVPNWIGRPVARWKTRGLYLSAPTPCPAPWMPGNAIFMATRRIGWCNSPYFMRSSRRFTRSSMATGGWVGCSCRCSCIAKAC